MIPWGYVIIFLHILLVFAVTAGICHDVKHFISYLYKRFLLHKQTNVFHTYKKSSKCDLELTEASKCSWIQCLFLLAFFFFFLIPVVDRSELKMFEGLSIHLSAQGRPNCTHAIPGSCWSYLLETTQGRANCTYTIPGKYWSYLLETSNHS